MVTTLLGTYKGQDDKGELACARGLRSKTDQESTDTHQLSTIHTLSKFFFLCSSTSTSCLTSSTLLSVCSSSRFKSLHVSAMVGYGDINVNILLGERVCVCVCVCVKCPGERLARK